MDNIDPITPSASLRATLSEHARVRLRQRLRLPACELLAQLHQGLYLPAYYDPQRPELRQEDRDRDRRRVVLWSNVDGAAVMIMLARQFPLVITLWTVQGSHDGQGVPGWLCDGARRLRKQAPRYLTPKGRHQIAQARPARGRDPAKGSPRTPCGPKGRCRWPRYKRRGKHNKHGTNHH